MTSVPRHHEVHFPRYAQDINTRRRTLLHLPLDRADAWSIGDELCLLAAPNFPRCAVAVVTSVRWVHLLAELDDDLDKLGKVDRGTYLANWDRLHPQQTAASDPPVLRIEFAYASIPSDSDDPPEWSLAS